MIDNDNDTIVNDEDTYNMIPSIAPKAKIKRRKSPLRSSSPVVRIYKLLASRLSSSLLASLILLPILPSGQKNVVFELIPLYKSLSALLARPHHTRHNHAARRQKRLLLLEQWLSYWTIYASLKFLENTRCNISTSQQRWRTLHNIIDILPHILKEKIGNLILLYTSRRPVAPPSPPPTIPSTSHNKSRDMTLATQLAGSPARWTILKCIVLFYSMDEELQGARWILNKIIRPIAGFFTGLDDGDGDIEDDEATFLLPHESGEALEGEDQDMDRESTGHLTKHNLSKPSSRHTHFPSTTRTTIPTRHDVDKAEADEQAEHTPHTPELSLDGSCGGSIEDGSPRLVWSDGIRASSGEEGLSSIKAEEVVEEEGIDIIVPKGARASWPVQTISVEGNHWVQ